MTFPKALKESSKDPSKPRGIRKGSRKRLRHAGESLPDSPALRIMPRSDYVTEITRGFASTAFCRTNESTPSFISALILFRLILLESRKLLA
jgi:hypothetical protein